MYFTGAALTALSNFTCSGATLAEDVSTTTLPSGVVTRNVLPNPIASEM